MHRRTAGVIFISISILLYGIRILSAAIMGSSNTAWYNTKFKEMLEFIGNGPIIVCWMAFSVGIVYLFWAEFESLKTYFNKNINAIKENWKEI